jgi:hypothetical protein
MQLTKLGAMMTSNYTKLKQLQQTSKGKGKVVPMIFLTEHHAMKAYWGSIGIAPRIL